ncbi:MAG: ABC transporter ATP-binding protein/permease [Clostridiales bacterium]|nr:ABC transporter ATP-binding protein/permease [Clostridiales bacterium]
MMPGEKARDFKGTIGKLLRYLGRYKFRVFAVMVFAAGGTVFSIVGPKVLSGAITELANGLLAKFAGTGGVDYGKIGTILLGLVGLYAASSLLMFAMGWIMSGVTQNISFNLRRDISEKIGRMPMKYFESRTVGEVLSRITNDVDTLGQSLNQSVTQLISSVCTIIGVLVMMLLINLPVTLITLAILPLSLGLVSLIVKFSQKHFITQQKYLGKLNGQVEETIGGHNVVKLFNYEGRAIADFRETNEVLFSSAWKSQFLSGLMMPAMSFVGNLGYVGVAIAGGVLAFRGVITIGDIQAFISYVRSFTQPISQAAQIMNMLQSMAAAAERVFEFLEEGEEEGSATDAIDAVRVRGNVGFERVHFGYDPEKTIINDFTCDVSSGQTVAIVGPTGAGKTTIVKLLMRFYDVGGGRVTVDGRDIRGLERGSLRACMGMVLQDTWLFKGTIRDNIRYGRLDATDAEVIEAAKAAHVHHFIQTLPGGYDMELNEDAANISQGQKQLLTIARAILADRPILILDEATSSVDTRTEVQIQAAMHNLMSGRTSFVIAHRLSTIRDADLILVMRGGDIVEQGTHAELLARAGFYAELYNSQFEPAEVA